jgi:hypothetical protein
MWIYLPFRDGPMPHSVDREELPMNGIPFPTSKVDYLKIYLGRPLSWNVGRKGESSNLEIGECPGHYLHY